MFFCQKKIFYWSFDVSGCDKMAVLRNGKGCLNGWDILWVLCFPFKIRELNFLVINGEYIELAFR